MDETDKPQTAMKSVTSALRSSPSTIDSSEGAVTLEEGLQTGEPHASRAGSLSLATADAIGMSCMIGIGLTGLEIVSAFYTDTNATTGSQCAVNSGLLLFGALGCLGFVPASLFHGQSLQSRQDKEYRENLSALYSLGIHYAVNTAVISLALLRGNGQSNKDLTCLGPTLSAAWPTSTLEVIALIILCDL